MTYANKRNAGFTLVEFLIAMAITVIVMAGAMLAFKDALRANQTVTLAEDLNENLRAGLNLMEQDLILAGSGIPTGGIPIPSTSNGNASNPCNVGVPINRPATDPTGIGQPAAPAIVFASARAAGGPFSTCNFILPAIEPGPGFGPPVTSPDIGTGARTDLITVLYADNSLGLSDKLIYAPATAAVPPAPANPGCPNGVINYTAGTLTVTFDAANCTNLATAGIIVSPGDLIMFSNVNGNALLTVTAVNGNTLTFAAGDVFALNGRTDPSGTIGSLETVANSNVFPPTTATRIWMISYYLDATTDPLHPRLARRVNFQAPQAVGETLEGLNFFYNYADGSSTPPVGQVGVPTTETENQIRSTNVYLAARSTNSGGNPPRYLRSSLTTQVSFRSMAFFNKYPN